MFFYLTMLVLALTLILIGDKAAIALAIIAPVVAAIAAWHCNRKAKKAGDDFGKSVWRFRSLKAVDVICACWAMLLAMLVGGLLFWAFMPKTDEVEEAKRMAGSGEVAAYQEDDEVEPHLDSDTPKLILGKSPEPAPKNESSGPSSTHKDAEYASPNVVEPATVVNSTPPILTFRFEDGSEITYRLECGHQGYGGGDNHGVMVTTVDDGFFIDYYGPYTWGRAEYAEFRKRFERSLDEHEYWLRYRRGFGWVVVVNPEAVDEEYADRLKELAEDAVKGMIVEIPRERYPWELKQ